MIRKILAALLLTAALCPPAQADFCERFQYTRLYLGPTLMVQDISADHASFRALHPRLSLGVADWSNRYYVGAELFFIPFNMDLSDRRGNTTARSAKTSNSFGVSVLPGARLYKEIWGYVRVGLITSRFVSPNSMALGGQLGAGLQTWLRPHLALRGEYIYTAYNSVSQVGTPNSNEFGLGFVYYC